MQSPVLGSPRPRRATATDHRFFCEPLERRLLFTALTIAQENALTGTPRATWDITGAGDLNLQGYATDISVNVGETVRFKINDQTLAPYHLDIYRLGYYQNLGARLITTIPDAGTTEQVQPAPITNSTTGLVDAGNWTVSATWAVPADATSGIYFAKVTREDNAGASHIFFIVRNDSGNSDLLFKTSDATWVAYNQYGGNSLYTGSSTAAVPNNRAVAVSYNRPIICRGQNFGAGFNSQPFYAEHAMVKWIERNGYEVSYFTDEDTDIRGSEILEHKVFMSVGHDEYWSGNERANVEAARAAGVNLAFFSGNEVYWKTRYTSSTANTDGTTTTGRVLVCYKESWANAVIDPNDPPDWTGTFRDPRFSPPAGGGNPENALSGTFFRVDAGPIGYGTAMTVTDRDASLRFWRNTSVASLTAGQSTNLGQLVLGYEWDIDLDNGSRPPGLIDMSTTTQTVPQLLYDYSVTTGSGNATHSLTMYRASSGAIVFGAGTIQWSWGLDGGHDGPPTTNDAAMQQATVNLLADMNVQPATLQAGLVAASISTDTFAPTATITSPPLTATSGTPVTITGTASDTGGGVVAGVEVSYDGGATWHPATGRTSWSYTWTPSVTGSVTLKTRAVDDSGNLQTPGAGSAVTVNIPFQPLTIFSNASIPRVIDFNDATPLELGVRFKSDVSGYILGIRFYKSAANTGTHIGDLWTNGGTKIGTATFTNETASGWQEVSFSAPVAITADTIYVASYHTNVGHYSANIGDYAGYSDLSNGPLHPLQDSAAGRNGLFATGIPSVFPNTPSPNSANYWVDVVFDSTLDTTAPSVSPGPELPAAGATNFDFTVTYTDVDSGLDASTFDNNDITVTGPNAFSANATFISANIPGAGSPRTVTYRITAPGGIWNILDNGTYTIHLNTNQVKDRSGNFAAAADLRTFNPFLPFAYKVGSTVFVDFYPAVSSITLNASAGDVTANDGTSNLSFTSVTSVLVTGTANNDVLNFNGPITPPITFAGGAGADTLNVNSGTFTFNTDAGINTSSLTVNVNGGIALFNATQRLAALNIANNARATFSSNGNRFLRTNTLSIASLGALDLNDNDLVVQNGNFSTIQGLVFNGYSSTIDTTRKGIVSTHGQGLGGVTILALFNNALTNITEWPPGSGNSIGAGAIVGKYTYFGDTDFDGQVTPQDYTAIDANLGATGIDLGIGWFFGDTDFDGDITPQDYTAIDAALGLGVGNPLSPSSLEAPSPLLSRPSPRALSLSRLRDELQL
jgi:hypothetical protein